MDLEYDSVDELARQLCKPEGPHAEKLGKAMADFNGSSVGFVIELLGIQPGDHVLEIGFGAGEGIAEAARLAGEGGFVAGIDHSEAMLAMAEQRNHRAVMREHVELTLGEAAALPYGDATFDKLFAVNVLHFWREPSRELAECLRVLQPGGRVAFYVTDPASWMAGLKETGVFMAYDAAACERLLSDAGFREVGSRELTSSDGKGYAVYGVKA